MFPWKYAVAARAKDGDVIFWDTVYPIFTGATHFS